MGYERIAVKSDAKSGYISPSTSYWVFNDVNRNRIMNKYHANIAKTTAIPHNTGITALSYPGFRLGKPVERFSGIRSSGQYCSPTERTKTDIPVTAFVIIRRQSAGHGMCPLMTIT
jgi:hypothetical protein